MAFMQCNFYSNVLDLSTSMNVILPQEKGEQPYPTLYLLHGLAGDHTSWMRRTSIERYALEAGIAVVMPEVHRSFYTDMTHGYPYWTFISEEVPRVAESFFPLSKEREQRFVAGLSMGGYGAFKLALRCPEKFSAAASLSGALDIVHMIKTYPAENVQEYKNIFGDLSQIENSSEDLMALIKEYSKETQPMLRLYQCCGTEDFLYEDNQRFKKQAETLGLNLTYEEGPGTHEWGYWDQSIKKVIQWLFKE
ncbi:MAG: esterase family protein [Epulopiscium sp.]|nr:esterase family protein [Candidatus Epulonipiscium sp.]